MAVLLVLSTFLVFIVIDFFLSRRKQKVETSLPAPASSSVPMLSSASIEGILVPDQLRFHAGHTWLFEESAKMARVGADALAVRVIGPVDRIELPKPGRWVRQGQRAFTFWTGTEKVELVSPAEGEVVEVNAAVLKDPSLAAKDPYGNGWLVKVSVPEPETGERNLLPRSLVRAWMKDEVRQVRAVAPQLARVAIMGGESAGTVGSDEARREVVHNILRN